MANVANLTVTVAVSSVVLSEAEMRMIAALRGLQRGEGPLAAARDKDWLRFLSMSQEPEGGE